MQKLLEELYKKHKLICEEGEEPNRPPEEEEEPGKPPEEEEEPGKPPEEGEVPPVGKLYLGNKDDTNYYIDVISSEDGVVEDIVIYDQEESQVLSAKEKELDVSDVKSTIINIVKDLELLTISVDVLFKYDLLGLEEEEEPPKEEEEPPKEEELELEGKKIVEPVAAIIEALKDTLELGDKSATFIANKVIEKLGGNIKLPSAIIENKYEVEFTTTDGKDDKAFMNVNSVEEAIEVAKGYDNFSSVISVKKVVKEGKIPNPNDTEEQKIKKLIEKHGLENKAGRVLPNDRNKQVRE